MLQQISNYITNYENTPRSKTHDLIPSQQRECSQSLNRKHLCVNDVENIGRRCEKAAP